MLRLLALCLIAVCPCFGAFGAGPVAAKLVPSDALFDVSGTKVGRFYPQTEGAGKVLAYLNGAPTFFWVYLVQDGTFRFAPGNVDAQYVYYDGPNCTGQAFVDFNIVSATLLPSNSQDATVFVAQPVPPAARTYVSRRSDLVNCDTDVPNSPVNMRPVAQQVNLSALFTPPYSFK